MLMKCVPDASILPSGTATEVVLLTRSTLNVRSVAPMHCGRAGVQYSGLAVSTMPCSGRSMATTMEHASAIASAIANAGAVAVMPCCTMRPASRRRA